MSDVQSTPRVHPPPPNPATPTPTLPPLHSEIPVFLPGKSIPDLPTHLSGASRSPSTMPDVTLLHFLSGDPRLPGASRP